MEVYYLKRKRKISNKEFYIITFLTHGGSTTISKLFVAPLERVLFLKRTQPLLFKNNFIQPNFSYKNIITSVYANQGWKSFWWGYYPSVCNICSFTILRLILHEKLYYHLGIKKEKVHGFVSFLMSYFSSCLAISLTYPLDVAYSYITLNYENTKDKKICKRGILLFIYDQIIKGKIRNLYCGLGLCFVNFIPYVFITTQLNRFFIQPVLTKESNTHITCKKEKEKEKESIKWNNYLQRDSNFYLKEKTQINSKHDVRNIESNTQTLEGYSSKLQSELNEEYKKLFKTSPNVSSYIFFGVVTGYIAQTITYPLETFRRKYQYKKLFEQNFKNSLSHYNNMHNIQNKNIVFHRISKYYKGFLLHSFKLIPEFTIFGFFFSYFKNNIPM